MQSASPMRVEALTFLRFVAAMLVVIHHYGSETRLVDLVPGRLETAAQMVCFFFVLSGFVLVFAYFRRPVFSTTRYAAARAARIVPSYALALGITVFYVYGYPFVDYTAVVLHALFLQAWFPAYALSLNPPAWSISTEVLFYISFPLIIMWLRERKPRVSTVISSALLFWVLTQLVLTWLINIDTLGPHGWIHTLVHHFPLSHLCSFVLGVAGGYLVMQAPREKRDMGMLSLLFLCISTAAVFWSLANKPVLESIGGVLLPLESSLLAPLFFLFILSISLADNVLTRALCLRPLVVLGEASYAVYILQAPLHHIYELNFRHRFELGADGHLLVFTSALTLIGIAVFYLLERPITHRVKSRVAGATDISRGENRG